MGKNFFFIYITFFTLKEEMPILVTINKKILIFDITDNAFKDKNAIISPEFYLNKFCLKIVHPIYGESLLSLGDFKIGLFINNTNK